LSVEGRPLDVFRNKICPSTRRIGRSPSGQNVSGSQTYDQKPRRSVKILKTSPLVYQRGKAAPKRARIGCRRRRAILQAPKRGRWPAPGGIPTFLPSPSWLGLTITGTKTFAKGESLTDSPFAAPVAARPSALPAPAGAKRLYGERDCGIRPNSREAAHRSGALRGGVAPLGWVTEDRVLCGLKSGKGLLPSPHCVIMCTQ
jgi:hypothetical protein